jgi:hypothetical protein
VKKTEAWIEEVAFCECPECSWSIELGTGLVWSEPLEMKCDDCGETFMVEAPGAHIN